MESSAFSKDAHAISVKETGDKNNLGMEKPAVHSGESIKPVEDMIKTTKVEPLTKEMDATTNGKDATENTSTDVQAEHATNQPLVEGLVNSMKDMAINVLHSVGVGGAAVELDDGLFALQILLLRVWNAVTITNSASIYYRTNTTQHITHGAS